MDNDTQTYFTVADNGDILALVRMSGDQYLKYVDGKWVEPAEDDRTAYDRSIKEIDPSKVSAAARLVAKMANISEAKGLLLES